ncbi:MAG: repeat-containing protein, partial [Chthonomonadales bacterium]|nr:repeat-containing protein [Chthonomonadales bacterium]
PSMHAQAGQTPLLKSDLANLKSKDAQTRVLGAISLGELGPKATSAVPALLVVLKDKNAEVRCAAADALGQIGTQPAIVLPALIEGFTEKDEENMVHFSAAVAKYAEKTPGALSRVQAALKDRSLRYGAAVSLGVMGKSAGPALPEVLALMQDPNLKVRTACAEALGAIGAPVEKIVPALVTALKDPSAEVRFGAADALSSIGTPASAALPGLVAALKDKDSDVRVYASLAITKMATKAEFAIPHLVEALQDDTVKVRLNAEYALGLIGAPSAPILPALLTALKDPVHLVNAFAGTNIRRIADALVVQKKTVPVAVLRKAIMDLQTARTTIEGFVRAGDRKDAMEGIAPALAAALDQLQAEVKSRGSQPAGLSTVALQTAAPQKRDAAAARQKIVQAEQIAAKIPEKELRVQALEDVAMAKARASDYAGARLMARALGTDVSKAKILQKMAVQEVYDGDFDESVNIVGGIASPDAKIQAYMAIIDALLALKKGTAASTVMEYAQLVKVPDGADGFFDLLSMGWAFGRTGDPEKTSAMATALKPGDPQQDEIKAALFTIAKAYNHDLAGAKAKFAGIHFGSIQLIVLEAMADAQLRSGDKAGAAETCKQAATLVLGAPIAPTGILLHIAHIQYDNGDAAGAQVTLKTAIEAAVKKADETALGAIAAGKAEMGEVEAAVKMIAQIKKPGDQVAARKAIAAAKAKTGYVAGALAMAPPDADAFCQTEVLVGTAQGILESLKTPSKP